MTPPLPCGIARGKDGRWGVFYGIVLIRTCPSRETALEVLEATMLDEIDAAIRAEQKAIAHKAYVAAQIQRIRENGPEIEAPT
jgi:hypothetical protein